MDVSFKLMRRSNDRLFLLSEITHYDSQLPVVLRVTTDQGDLIPAETFPYVDLDNQVELENALENAAIVRHVDGGATIRSSASTGVRRFVVVLPWLKLRRVVLEFSAVDSDGTVVDSCKHKLDQEVVKWQARLNSATNAAGGEAIETLDGCFVHDRIQVDFQRIIALGEGELATAQVELPYFPESELEVSFFGAAGKRIDVEYHVIEDSISPAADSGVSLRRYLLISFEVPATQSQLCLCVGDRAGKVSLGFAVLGPDTVEEITDDMEWRTMSAYNDPSYDEWFKEEHRADVPTLLEQVSQRFGYEPLISVVCLLRDEPLHHLYDLLTSFRLQTYTNWELILVRLAETDNTADDIMANFESDERIYLLNVESDLSLAGKANAGLQAAEGDFVGFISADDKISPDALFEFVRKVNDHPDCEIVYCDTDTVDADGDHSQPMFLPDFSPELLHAYNYMRGLVLFRSSLAYEVGMFSEDPAVLPEYDFILRATEVAACVCHVPRVLCHRRFINRYDIFTLFTEERNEAGRKALVEHCKRVGINAEVLATGRPFQYRLRHFLAQDPPKIGVIIVSRGNTEMLDICVKNIYAKARYANFEVIVVDCDEQSAQDLGVFEGRYDNLKVLRWEHPYSAASVANYTIENTDAAYYLFMDEETRMLSDDALEIMLGYFQSSRVGVVGAHQYFADGTIEHAGLVVGGSRAVTPLGRYMSPEWRGYQDRNVLACNVTAVSGSCMMISREVYDQVGGFTEDFTLMYADVDFCLKAAELGFLTVSTPYAEFSHFKSVKRARTYTMAMRLKIKREAALLQYFWPRNFTEGDAYYNRNLDQDSPYYALPHDEEW